VLNLLFHSVEVDFISGWNGWPSVYKW